MNEKELFNLRSDINYINRVKILGGVFLCGLILLMNIMTIGKPYAVFGLITSALVMFFAIFLGIYAAKRKEQKIREMIIKLKRR